MLFFDHKFLPIQLKLNPPCLGYTDRVLRSEEDFIEIEKWLNKKHLSGLVEDVKKRKQGKRNQINNGLNALAFININV